MAKRRVEQGPTGRQVQENVRARRDIGSSVAGLGQMGGDTLAALSERMSEVGRPMSVNTLSEIQNGARRVDVDDLTALAAALGVSPLSLLLPAYTQRDDLTEVTGIGRTSVETAWRWMRDGDTPASRGDERSYEGTYSKDDMGAVRYGPHYQLEFRLAVLRRRAVFEDEIDHEEAPRAVETLRHDARVAWRRLQENGPLPEGFPFETFYQRYRQMIALSLVDEGIHGDD